MLFFSSLFSHGHACHHMQYTTETKTAYIPHESTPSRRFNNNAAVYGSTVQLTDGIHELPISTSQAAFIAHRDVVPVEAIVPHNYTVSAGLAGWEHEPASYTTTQRDGIGNFQVDPAAMKEDHRRVKHDARELKSFLSTTHYVLGNDDDKNEQYKSMSRDATKDAANYTYVRPHYDRQVQRRSDVFANMQTEPEPEQQGPMVELRGRMIAHHAGTEYSKVCCCYYYCRRCNY